MASTTDEHIHFYLNDLSVGYLTMYSIYNPKSEKVGTVWKTQIKKRK